MKHIHFIGIGGISMSGLARVLHSNNHKISGSDERQSKITDELSALGMDIKIGHFASNIDETIDLIVYTAAISKNNPELLEAKKLGIKTIDRATLLGEIMDQYKYSIGVAGTHGKTTTTSLVAHLLLQAEKDPTISIGGILNAINSNILIGHSQYFLTEACEYCDSFLKLSPYIGIILNVDEDHLDYFKDLAHIQSSFRAYAERIPSDGYLIINNDIENIEKITAELDCEVVTFGLSETASLYAKEIRFHDSIYPIFEVYYENKLLGEVELNIPGMHNVHNALAAIASGLKLGIDFDTICKGLFQNHGTKKRFEIKGRLGNITIVDDYAHHPTEILASLDIAKKYPHNKLWVAFQPHTYTRTKALLTEFASALSQADHLIIGDIYSAREIDTGEIHSKDLVEKIKLLNPNVHYFSSFDEIENFLLENCCPHDLLITMGAGNISIVGDDLLGL